MVVVLPMGYQLEALRSAHDEAGHFGQHKTHDSIIMRFTWPDMKKDIAKFVNSCPHCQKGKANRKGMKFAMKPILTTRPNELLIIDFLKLSVSYEGHVGLIVMIDHFSKFAQAIPLQEFTAASAADAICNSWICNFGIPDRILSDQGSQFESALFKEFLEVFGIQKSHSTAYHPQTNGLVERHNRTILQMLRIACHKNQNAWHEHLPQVTMAYNFAVHESTKYTPFRLLTGREARTPVWFLFPDWNVQKKSSMDEHVRDLVNGWEKSIANAQKELKKAQLRQTRNHNRKAIRGERVQENDLAIVFCDVVPVRGVKKLTRKWKGPFRCAEVLDDGRRYRFHEGIIAHAERVLRYESRPTDLLVDSVDGEFIIIHAQQGPLTQATPPSVYGGRDEVRRDRTKRKNRDDLSTAKRPRIAPSTIIVRSDGHSDDEDSGEESWIEPSLPERGTTPYNLRPRKVLKSTYNENFVPHEADERRRMVKRKQRHAEAAVRQVNSGEISAVEIPDDTEDLKRFKRDDFEVAITHIEEKFKGMSIHTLEESEDTLVTEEEHILMVNYTPPGEDEVNEELERLNEDADSEEDDDTYSVLSLCSCGSAGSFEDDQKISIDYVEGDSDISEDEDSVNTEDLDFDSSSVDSDYDELVEYVQEREAEGDLDLDGMYQNLSGFSIEDDSMSDTMVSIREEREMEEEFADDEAVDEKAFILPEEYARGLATTFSGGKGESGESANETNFSTTGMSRQSLEIQGNWAKNWAQEQAKLLDSNFATGTEDSIQQTVLKEPIQMNTLPLDKGTTMFT